MSRLWRRAAAVSREPTEKPKGVLLPLWRSGLSESAGPCAARCGGPVSHLAAKWIIFLSLFACCGFLGRWSFVFPLTSETCPPRTRPTANSC